MGMKTVRTQILGGLAAVSICIALLLSILVLVCSLRVYDDTVGSFCGTRIGQFRDVVEFSFLAVTALGMTGASMGVKRDFYPRLCLLGMITSFLVSVASLVLIGNH